MKELEKLTPATETVACDAHIIDGMSLVHKVAGDGKTFGEIVVTLLKLALSAEVQVKELILFSMFTRCL